MADKPAYWGFIGEAFSGLARTSQRELDPEATRLLLTLNRASGVIIYDLEASVHRPRGRSWAAYRLMFVLWLSGEVESKRLARLTGQSRAATSNLTGPLVKAGVLARRDDPTDGRAVLLSLTADGTREIEDVYAAQNARERAWANALTEEERATLMALLEKLMSPDFEVLERD